MPRKTKFKLGDLITGKDRSYVRSIYRYEGPGSKPGFSKVRFVAIDGIINQDAVKITVDRNTKAIEDILGIERVETNNERESDRPTREFRLATDEEVQMSFILKSGKTSA